MHDEELQPKIEALFEKPERTSEAKVLLARCRELLQEGTIRVAEPAGDFDSEGVRPWKLNLWVKKAILLLGSCGELKRMQLANSELWGTEMDTLPWLNGVPEACRVPLGSSMRQGVHLSRGVTCMPPSILQVGAHIGEGASIDSMSSVGLGAQVGAGAQLSNRVTVGGWMLPLQHLPTIVEDGVILATGSGVYDGAQVGRNAILLANTQITPALGLLDLRDGTLIQKAPGRPLMVPPNAIVAMGTRTVRDGIALQVPVIVGRRAGRTAQEWEKYTDISLTVE